MNCGDVIRKAAWVWPDAVAIRCGDTSLTFSQVYERSCRQVNALTALGLRAQDRVALLGANGLWSMEEMIGLALGGFTRLSLHGRNTVVQHRDMLDRVGARALIVDEASYPVVAGLAEEIDSLEYIIVHGSAGGLSYEDLLSSAEPDDPFTPVAAEDVNHLAFTSGTTGRPKAAVHTHGGWLGVMSEYLLALPPLSPQDRYLAVAPLSHAASTVLFGVISRGASTVAMAGFDEETVAREIEASRVTFTLMVPTMIQRFVNHPRVRAGTYDLSSLRILLATGAPITEQTIRDAWKVVGPALCQSYGQSESIPITFMSSAEYADVLDGDGDERLLRSAGRPTPTSMVKILDEDGTRLGPYEPGEIAIDTPGAMKEFWEQPDETAARFTEDGYILSRDVGYLDDRGYLFISDRKDDLIISGGYNIWPAEVENAIQSHPEVLEVAVVGVPHPEWGETPKAFVVRRDDAVVTEADIVDWCRERIGSMKKPTSVVFHDGPLPKSPVGKLLRRALRDPEWAGRADGEMRVGGA